MKSLKHFNLWGIILSITSWLNKLLSQDSTASTKRTAYLIVVIASLCWLSYNLYNSGISELWVMAYQTLIASVGLSYVGGVALEKVKKSKKEELDESDS